MMKLTKKQLRVWDAVHWFSRVGAIAFFMQESPSRVLRVLDALSRKGLVMVDEVSDSTPVSQWEVELRGKPCE